MLRINTSYVAYAALIQARLAAFGERYPEITLDITIDNNLSDIVAGGFDAGIRLGHALQRDMIADSLRADAAADSRRLPLDSNVAELRECRTNYSNTIAFVIA